MTTRFASQMIAASLFLLLAGCKTPFAGKLASIDWTGTPSAGTISVSQPKMYRRASLINERLAEVQWLAKELENSKTAEFKPEIVRDSELVQSLAFAGAARADPGAALRNRRIDDIEELRHQRELITAQYELDQIRRNTELARARLAAQNEPSVSAPTDGAGKAPDATEAIEVEAGIDELDARVQKRLKLLTDQFERKAEAIAVAPSGGNPGDLLRDRASLRGQITAASSSAGLDDLHDVGGRALIRLNFQATVIPAGPIGRVPGAVQMTIRKPEIGPREEEAIYRGWLAHINGRLNRESATGFTYNTELLQSAVADYFDLVEYHYALTASSAGASDPPCGGLHLGPAALDKGCAALVFAVPRFRGTSVQEGADATLEAYGKWFNLNNSEQVDAENDRRSTRLIQLHAGDIVRGCALPSDAIDGGMDASRLYHAVEKARIRIAAGDAITLVERAAQRALRLKKIASPPGADFQMISKRTARARRFLATFIDFAYARCPPTAIDRFERDSPALYVPTGFTHALRTAEEPSIYEIGPREQVQHVSSVARVASSLSLALALAGSAPGSGVGASAAADYSRQAIGKAATIERVPALVGYAASRTTFGWVIAPKAVFDPSGNIELEQTLRTLDLSVDLSVPSWWPFFHIDTVTSWSPDPAAITSGAIALRGQAPVSTKVQLDSNYADFHRLTERLLLGGLQENRKLALDDSALARQSVSACRRTSLYIKGANIWRANAVLIAGVRLDETSITVAPDMSGILLAVPELGTVLGDIPAQELEFSVLTRYGDAHGTVNYMPMPVAGSCKAPGKELADDGPTIASLDPLRFRGGAAVIFNVAGSKLDQVDRVTINGQPGAIDPARNDKTMRVSFDAARTASIPASRSIALVFFKGDAKLVEKLVEVVASTGD